jgi:hypothetical protein
LFLALMGLASAQASFGWKASQSQHGRVEYNRINHLVPFDPHETADSD